MKTALAFLLVGFFSYGTSMAQNVVTVGKIAKKQETYYLMRQQNNDKTTTLSVEINQVAPVIWSKTYSQADDGTSILDYWTLVDACRTGNNVSLLLSTGSEKGDSLFWVKVTQVNGLWTLDYEVELFGAASFSLGTTGISLGGTDSVLVTDGKGVTSTYTRNSTGQVLKNGAPFANTSPYTIPTP